MKAEIKSYYSNDFNMVGISDLNMYSPQKTDDFSILLTVIIGPVGEEIEESLDFFICTPKCLLSQYNVSEVILARNYIIVFEYNFERILNHIKKLINSVEGDTWGEVGQKLSRYEKMGIRRL